jgi:hypothetical protein
MTKEQEITILRETAERLGADSYCGPWLKEALPFIESNIKSDLYPMIRLPHEAHNEAMQILKDAKLTADNIEGRANDLAEAVRAQAYKDRDLIMNAGRRQLEALLAKL